MHHDLDFVHWMLYNCSVMHLIVIYQVTMLNIVKWANNQFIGTEQLKYRAKHTSYKLTNNST